MADFAAGIDQENNMLAEMTQGAKDLHAHFKDRQEFYQNQLDQAKASAEKS